MTSKLPRFDIAAGALARGGADQLVRPLPGLLDRLVADSDEAKAHHDVAARYGEQRTRVAGLREAIVKAEAKDAAAERSALAKGTRVPKPTAPVIEDELAEAERQLGVLDSLVGEYAASLLRVVVEHLPEALEQGQAVLDAALADVREAIDRAVATLSAANEAAAEYGWVVGLDKTGHAYAFTAGRGVQLLPSVQQALAGASAGFDYDLQRRAEVVDEIEREAQADAARRLSPGTTVWQAGQTFVVDDAGELVPAEGGER